MTNNTSKIILCTGGARSGKSEFAEQLVLSLPGTKGYVATSQIFDDEMEDRVAKHKARRGAMWQNFEIPYDLAASWPKVLEQCDVILVDCLTMYATNAMLKNEPHTQAACNEIATALVGQLELILSQSREAQKTVVFVTNELGLGIVPENRMARFFRDIAGLLNQAVAKNADEVYFTISGITTELKSKEVHI
ncbi:MULTISPECIES: bifunctional adenosylcobinamide kinase/adenosylcobinamide-phosphate guanylyltransferase [unclassified Veillonella]|uniref:bifunctional adenosylcobinamide kinase/adenosylcobinamide-phosphate guanylyltransferase n=1 Tax=unclassified Veillonella TaxID=2630086 RepID=UPI00138A21AB|nr:MULTISPECIES: bifunctional adenosylcobinamide kinase/adenosylcobinamide-phosphate guanylyltransferase [unclassified Veillonella]KAF1682382.1 bifunctional adenosylcobinamide kinase/adenosylcobinamide-phosphate guanylyltransferase [Veillonella sp. R32]